MDVSTSPGPDQLPPLLWREVADEFPQLAWITDSQGRAVWFNKRAVDFLGLSLEELLGDGWGRAIHPDAVQRVADTWHRAVQTQTSYECHYPLRQHDGSYREFLARAEPHRGSDGKVDYWFGTSTDVTDQRFAQETARMAAEEIEAIYATTPIGLAILDKEMRFVRINERMAEINGIPAAEHLGKTVRELLPDLADQGESALRRVFAGEEIIGLELNGETPAFPGVVRTWRENWLPVRSAAGDITGVAISAEEITAAKAAEVALARSEAQFRTLAEALPGMLFITAPDGGNSYVNDTFARYTGRPKEELLGTGWAGTLHPDDVERGWACWNEAVRSGSRYETEYRIRRHDGEFRWHTVSALPVPMGEDGAEKRWVGTAVDIHDRKLVEQEIQEAEARYRAIFEQAGVGVARVSPDGPFLEINDRYCQILRRSREEVLGSGWQSITHPDDIDRDVAQVRAMLRGESKGFDSEKRYVAPDGSDIWVNLTLGAQYDDDGKLLCFIPIAEDISARKAAEEALRAKEERYRALFESMEQGFCTIQVTFDEHQTPVDYRFTELNPAFSRHTGLGPEVLNGSVREAVPGLEQSWFERYGNVALTGQHVRFIDHAEPLGRWFEVYAFPIGARADNTVAILFTDVTERVEQEEALRRSEQELRVRLNAIPQMVWSTLPDGYHDFYNDRWYEFTGTPFGSTDGAGWNGMFHPEDQALAWQTWKESLETGKPYEIEYRLRHHTGAYRWVLGRALPIRNEAGDIVRWMGTCTDIDDRIEADRALRAGEARLRAILEAVPVGLIFSDSNGRLTGSNHQVTELIDQELVESASVSSYRDDYVAFHANGRQVESEEYPLARALAGEERPELECQVRRGDGSLRWLRYVAAPIRDEADGPITGGVVASIDIDHEKRLTEGLEREVEKVVAEREAAQDALRQSQKLEAMGQLTGGVAHDFNNLLTPIIGSLDLLQRKQVLDDRTGRLVEGALASAEKARVLVQRLLAFARRQPLKPQAIDLKLVVSEMSELVDSTSGPRIRVVTQLPPELPAALADGNQLEMALLNLSVNARDAMPEGGTLSIGAREEPEGSGRRLGLPQRPHVVLSVSDTGLGMDEDTRRRAIEPFFSTKGVGKGTGLGLSMVHGLAAQLGGALDIRSAPGMGTTIELWLPLAEGEATHGIQAVGEPDAHGAGTVLLVDDEELVRASTAGMLADLGYRVIEADSGEAALALVADGLVPNLLVTDQLMPGLSGTDLAVRLRERVANLPVLVVSGYADLESLSPAFPHLSKPFRQSELAAALEKVTA
ncbi:PAS domain S-box-containing protein [Sphingomonas kaistensis]|uniref:histidine kinase n=1 Tax=Sphingomonas kaistensis TaxID=298708 RepID=A0A7X6BH10_9SPHN|nr:PAS domain S-box protein [Sphingomonas kaistensis]NJC06458.1 PAS domain S-box-containing protein [Sphingomonas kaistensis]